MKAILVVYVPEEYSEQLDRLSIDYTLFYHDENGTVKQVDVESRCPLKPMPEKVEMPKIIQEQIDGWHKLAGEYIGYNACIDEILGEQK